MTEAQKYEGHLYREKPNKAVKRKSVSILEPNENNALVPRHPTVEDVKDDEIPPHVPTPPPAVKNADSVFDYLVEEEDPNAPQIEFATEREEMFMKNSAPSLFGGSRPTSRNEYRSKEEQLESEQYQQNGFTYGAEPINPRPTHDNASTTTLDFMTPSAKVAKAKLDRAIPDSAGHSRQNSNSEKKRKRAPTDDHGDINMLDAPGTVVRSVVDIPGAVSHSGLTGGLQRMLAEKEDDWGRPRSPPTSPDVDPNRRALTKLKPVKTPKHHDREPQSPLKRTRRSKEEDNGLGISIKGRAGRVMSMINGALSTSAEGAVAKSTSRRRGSSSDPPEKERSRGREGEKQDRKKHKVTRHNGTSSANVRIERPSRSKKRHDDDSPEVSRERNANGKQAAQKAIEYHPHPRRTHSSSDSDDERARRDDHQMVVFGAEDRLRRKCEDFLAYITKGPDSSKGYSVNKVLKRYHKDSDITREADKREEEKDLWKGLRLKRNDRGEVVVFFA